MTGEVGAARGAAGEARRPAGRALRLLILLLCLLAVGQSFVVALVSNRLAGQLVVTGDENGLLVGVAFGLLAVVGGLAAMGQPRNAVGWVLLFTGLAVGAAGSGGTLANYALHVQGDPARAAFFSWLGGLGWYGGLFLLFLVFPFLFPDGRPPGRRWRWVFAAAVAFVALFLVAYGVLPLVTGVPFDANALEERLRPAFWALPVFLVLGIVSLVVRYRHAGPDTRQQMKWLALTMAVPLAVFAVGIALQDGLGWEVSDLVWGALYLLFPLGLGVALLRYKLFDVDTVIRRTVQYVIVTGLLGLLYYGTVLLLQRAFSDVTGQTSTAAVVLSTLAIAALFNPVRRRVQGFIDRRFYRRKYNAEQVLARFAATARDETDLDALTAELLRVIQETMQPAHVALWLADSSPRAQRHEDAQESAAA